MGKIVIAIVVSGGRFLMVRRKQKEGDLHWQFPAGGIEKDESDFEAAKREVLEETDIICQPSRILGQRTHPNTGREVVYVQCKYVTGIPTVKDNEEVDHAEWMSPGEISKVVTSDIFPPVRRLIDEIGDPN